MSKDNLAEEIRGLDAEKLKEALAKRLGSLTKHSLSDNDRFIGNCLISILRELGIKGT
jgi:hypothetical protein